MSTKDKKQKLRSSILQKRRRLSVQEQLKANSRIIQGLKTSLHWGSKQVVHVYLPIEGKNEIDTWPIVEWLLENGHEVWASYLPEDESQDGFCQISKVTKYKKDRFGSPLPIEKVHKKIKPSVIIVPCLATDKKGNRFGYGSGWYDQFLARHPKATKIGLVYDQFLLDKIPHETHDIKLDFIVAESNTISLK